MRKKLKQRQTAKPAKFAEGGAVRTRGRSQGLRQRAPIYGPDPVEMTYGLRAPLAEAIREGAAMGGVAPEPALPVPPEFVAPPRRPAPRRRTSRNREMTADELNDREMTRILNERSLEAAKAGRNMYARGGLVKPRKKGAC